MITFRNCKSPCIFWKVGIYIFKISVPLIYIDAANDDQIGGADIIYQKEIIKKIPGKAGCLKKVKQ